MSIVKATHSRFVNTTKDYDVWAFTNENTGATIVMSRYGKIGAHGRVTKKRFEGKIAAVAIANARRELGKISDTRINNGYSRKDGTPELKLKSAREIGDYVGAYTANIDSSDYDFLFDGEIVDLVNPAFAPISQEEAEFTDERYENANWGSW